MREGCERVVERGTCNGMVPLATRFRFRNDILPVSSSSNNRKAFRISSRESDRAKEIHIKSVELRKVSRDDRRKLG